MALVKAVELTAVRVASVAMKRMFEDGTPFSVQMIWKRVMALTTRSMTPDGIGTR